MKTSMTELLSVWKGGTCLRRLEGMEGGWKVGRKSRLGARKSKPKKNEFPFPRKSQECSRAGVGCVRLEDKEVPSSSQLFWVGFIFKED